MSNKLKQLSEFHGRPGPLVLVILDGVGLGRSDESNGVYMAKTPCLDGLLESKLYTTLQAHGTAVGMPSDDDMGNSEVGHNALGAGRVFDQGATLVKRSVENEDIYTTPTWNKLLEKPKNHAGTLHFIGLLSDGNVHSHTSHLFAMLRQCAKEGVQTVRIHALLDGRDVHEKSALHYIGQTEDVLNELRMKFNVDYQFASGGGRMVTTMDRYNADWTIVKRGWDAHVLGRARAFSSATQAVETYYAEDDQMTDQYLDSFVIHKNGKPVGTIQDGDSVVFYNFRGDRAIELSMAFEAGVDFDKFDRERVPNVIFAGMMEYDGDLHIPKNFLVIPPQIDRAVSSYMCAQNITTLAISETQKYGHVTYFWNGNKSGYVSKDLETYIEIPSDKIQFDKAPKMKAHEITDKTIEMLKTGKYKFARINYPNGDMVGHTGVEAAIISTMETVDECLSKLLAVVNDLKGIAVILADHGNADVMFTVKNGKKIVSTAHSLNPVPFVIVDSGYSGEYKMAELENRGLSNVASTLLNLLGFEKPSDYDPALIQFV